MTTSRKISRGRQKIPMRKITNPNSLYATFSKRRDGIFKKASELSLECNVNVGVIIYSPTGKPHSFMAPTPGTVAKYGKIDINQDAEARFSDACNKAQIGPLCRHVGNLEAIKKAAVQRGLQEMAKAKMVIESASCLTKPVNDLGYQEVKNMEAWIAYTLYHLKNRALSMADLNSRFGF